MPLLKPSEELIVAATGVTVVMAIFANGTPGYDAIRADAKGTVNTHKSTKMAAITSTAVIGTLALLGKSPTIFTVGGATILLETWKQHYANYGANGTTDNAAAPSYNG